MTIDIERKPGALVSALEYIEQIHIFHHSIHLKT